MPDQVMHDSKADEYLQEWVSAEAVQHRYVIPECCPLRTQSIASFLFDFAIVSDLLECVTSLRSFRDTHAAKHALDECDCNIGVQQVPQLRSAANQEAVSRL